MIAIATTILCNNLFFYNMLQCNKLCIITTNILLTLYYVVHYSITL